MGNTYILDPSSLTYARNHYRQFLEKCHTDDGQFLLTRYSEPSPYALCFAIFGYRLLYAEDVIDQQRVVWDRMLRTGLSALREQRLKFAKLQSDKSYLQLLTFTLSALSILGTLNRDPLAQVVCEVLPDNIEQALIDAKALQGIARSGNQAMFLGVLLLHARDHLGMDTQPAIEQWVALHLDAMNQFGFWGNTMSMSHLQFQNGYHQYELLEYLETDGVPWERAANAVASLADYEGHFAPYPGGGGCYDYDAVFILTSKDCVAKRHTALLQRTADTLLSEQNPDGGFCESLRVRPRSLENLSRSWSHLLAGRGQARRERIRFALTLLRPVHDRIHTHWSQYSREWGESDLWDSWFRMLTLARIDCALDPELAANWGFIDYPGIGFHPSLHTHAST